MAMSDDQINVDIKCDFCGKSFSSKMYLSNHISRTHADKQKCDICGKYVVKGWSGWYFKKHISSHYNKPGTISTCETCGKEFSCKQNLKKHILSIHEGKKWQCETCDKYFNCKGDLVRHIAVIHDRVKNQKCTLCEKAYAIEKDLKRHLKTAHSRIKEINNENCDKCDKSFSSKSTLTEHIFRVHSDAKKFKCDICGKEYKKKDLKKHRIYS